jgi:hypothetical protein
VKKSEKVCLEILGLDRSVLKWVLRSEMGRHAMDCSGLGQGQVVGFCKRCNEPSGFHKIGDFLKNLRTCLLLRKDRAPWS